MLVASLLFLSTALYIAIVAFFIFATHRQDLDLFPSPEALRISWWNPSLFGYVFSGTLAVIFGAALYKYLELGSDGATVAESIGGRLVLQNTSSSFERRLLNVVEEMSLASGIVMPRVYLIEEMGINAFAAGLSPNEAVIGVTRGAIERLSRDELQGVIAHEFSHILNGDIRLNLRLVAYVYGLIFVALIGEFLFRIDGRAGSRATWSWSNNRKKGSGLALLGLGIWVLGSLGVLCSRVIKSSISRQREFLADAAAVQFTRNPSGIASALKKIMFGSAGDRLSDPHEEEVSHFLFSHSRSGFFSGLLATHPPLLTRITRLDPNFRVDEEAARTYGDSAVAPDFAESGAIGLAGTGEGVLTGQPRPTSRGIVASVGTVSEPHLVHAKHVLEAIPPVIHSLLRRPETAQSLIFALAISSDSEIKLRQMERLARDNAATGVLEIVGTVVHLPAALRLPIVQLSLGVLSELDKAQAHTFLVLLRDLCALDDKISFFECALLLVVRVTLQRRFNLLAPASQRIQSLNKSGKEIAYLFSRLAEAGTTDRVDQERAFRAGTEGLVQCIQLPETPIDLLALNDAIMRLRDVSIEVRAELVERASKVVLHDHSVTVEETELFRALCTVWECPVPPWI